MKLFATFFCLFAPVFLSAASAAQVQEVNIPSASMNKDLPAVVVLPDSYDKTVKAYPVVYLLHGYSMNPSKEMGDIGKEVTDAADRFDMIIILPDGGYDSWYFDSPVDPNRKYETFIASEVVSFADSSYRTIPARWARAITGGSMGGHGAMFVALRHKETFGAVGSLSGVMDFRAFPPNDGLVKALGPMQQFPQRWQQHIVVSNLQNLKPQDLTIYIDIGDTDFFLADNRAFHKKLLEMQIPHSYTERPGHHDLPYWKAAVKAQMIFLAKMFTEKEPDKKPKTAGLPEPVVEKVNSVNVIVDPRIELIAVVQQISQYPDTFPFLMNRNEFEYRKKVLEHFLPYKDHDVIKMFNEISRKPQMYNFAAPPESMLYISYDFALRSDLAENDFLIKRIGGRENLIKFIGLLKDFSEKTSFNEFFNDNRDFYKSLVADVKSSLGSRDCVKEIETFYGQKNKSYYLVLVPLYNYVGFGPHLTYKDGQKDIFDIMGPKDPKTLVFGDAYYFAYMQRHEFSHPFVNPLTEKYWDSLKNYSYLLDASKFDLTKKKITADWQECVNEYIIRAVTTHLAYLESDEAGKARYKWEKDHGVVYLDELLAKLKEYEQQRDRYPTFECFYPELIKVFQKKA
jgi:S-formylglutathione hydrolase FrmB